MDFREFKIKNIRDTLGISKEQFLRILAFIDNASQIKSHVAQIKQKPGVKPGSADSSPESSGRY